MSSVDKSVTNGHFVSRDLFMYYLTWRVKWQLKKLIVLLASKEMATRTEKLLIWMVPLHFEFHRLLLPMVLFQWEFNSELYFHSILFYNSLYRGMRIKATIVAYALLVKLYTNATIRAYTGLRVKHTYRNIDMCTHIHPCMRAHIHAHTNTYTPTQTPIMIARVFIRSCMKCTTLDGYPFTWWSLSSKNKVLHGRIVVHLSQEQLGYSTQLLIY